MNVWIAEQNVLIGGLQLAAWGEVQGLQLFLNGSRELVCVGYSESQLMRNDNLIPTPSPKLERDDVRVSFLGGYFEDGREAVFVFDATPACSVRELSQDNQTVCRQHQVTGGGEREGHIDTQNICCFSLCEATTCMHGITHLKNIFCNTADTVNQMHSVTSY